MLSIDGLHVTYGGAVQALRGISLEVPDGKVVAAAEEERFTQIKHCKRPIPFSAYELPYHAIDYCLAEAGVTLGDVDHVA